MKLGILFVLLVTLSACQGTSAPTSVPSVPTTGRSSSANSQTAPTTAGSAASVPPTPAPTLGGVTIPITPNPGLNAPGLSPTMPLGTPAAVSPITNGVGKILYARDGGMATLDPTTGTVVALPPVPDRTFVGAPAVSPDGKQVAYSLYDAKRAAEKRDNGTDLYVMGVDGQNQRLLLEHDEIGAWLSEPTWLPDNKGVYFTRRDAKGQEQIERLSVDGTTRQVVIKDATSPSIVDGKQVAYLTTDPQSYAQSLFVASIDGSNPRRLLGDPEFEAIANPRLSPDSRRIAFVGVGGPNQMPQRTAQQSPLPRVAWRALGWLDPQAWFNVPTAAAHGIPYNLWTVNIDGSDLKRLTLDLEVELPMTVWSPDGKWLAFTSDRGIEVVSADGKEKHFLGREFAVGGLDWTPR